MYFHKLPQKYFQANRKQTTSKHQFPVSLIILLHFNMETIFSGRGTPIVEIEGWRYYFIYYNNITLGSKQNA